MSAAAAARSFCAADTRVRFFDAARDVDDEDEARVRK
jgi:hypothetical protein